MSAVTRTPRAAGVWQPNLPNSVLAPPDRTTSLGVDLLDEDQIGLEQSSGGLEHLPPTIAATAAM